MLDHTARSRAPVRSAPVPSPSSPLTTSAASDEDVPFQHRDFRAAARGKAVPSFVPEREPEAETLKGTADAPAPRTVSENVPEVARPSQRAWRHQPTVVEHADARNEDPVETPVVESTDVEVPVAEMPAIENLPVSDDAPAADVFVVLSKASSAAPPIEEETPVNISPSISPAPAAAAVVEEMTAPVPQGDVPSVEVLSKREAKTVLDMPSLASPAAAEEPVAVSADPERGFRQLDLDDEVVLAVEQSGYAQPTEIQAEIIPHLLAGRDVLAQSQTGSGKTAAFALPILSSIEIGHGAQHVPQVLVLAPTRELAVQVAGSFSTYAANLSGFSVAAIYGGQSYDAQFRQLKRGVQVVVGTPGRVIDHINRGTLDLSALRCLVLDEADEMLNMGFLDDVRFVLDHTPAERQVALFSATLPGPIRTIAEQYLKNPVRVTIKCKTMTADSINQTAIFVTPRNKMDVLKRVLEAEETKGVLIFAKTRESTVAVAEKLSHEGFKAVALNGDMPQNVRERTIDQLRSGRLDLVVATDVAARGLDVARISHVINFDVPNDNESYIHRVGRTGRAGRAGKAIILLKKTQRGRLRQIERATKQSIEIVNAPSAADINASRTRQFVQRVADTVTQEDLSVFEELIARCAGETGSPIEKIAAALALIGQAGRPFFVEESRTEFRDNRDEFSRGRDGNDGRSGSHDDGSRGPRGNRRSHRDESGSGPVEAGMVRYRIAVGHDDGVRPGNIVGAVANEGGVDGSAIGAIRIYSNWSTIDLPEGMPDHVRDALQSTRVAGRPLQLREYRENGEEHSGRRSRFQGNAGNHRAQGGRKQSGKPGGKPAGKQVRAKKPVLVRKSSKRYRRQTD